MAFKDSEIVQAIWTWLKDNYIQLIIAAATILVAFIILIIIKRSIKRLEKRDKLTKQYSKVLIRGTRFVFFLIFLFSILIAFNVTVGAITGAIALLSGTILGFAAINTLGNAIAGLIIMISKPIHIGDRIYFKEQYADVVSVELIYTKLQTMENALIVIPSQELLKMEIVNYGQDVQLRRGCKITVDYKIESRTIEKMLKEVVKGVEGILEEPEPTISLTDLQNYAVEYSLFYSIANTKEMFSVASQLRKNILKAAKKHNIDLRTPDLLQNLK